jgi:hypothetical protein
MIGPARQTFLHNAARSQFRSWPLDLRIHSVHSDCQQPRARQEDGQAPGPHQHGSPNRLSRWILHTLDATGARQNDHAWRQTSVKSLQGPRTAGGWPTFSGIPSTGPRRRQTRCIFQPSLRQNEDIRAIPPHLSVNQPCATLTADLTSCLRATCSSWLTPSSPGALAAEISVTRRSEAISRPFRQAPRSPLWVVESTSFRQAVPWHGGLVEGVTRRTAIDPAPVSRRTPSGRCGNRSDIRHSWQTAPRSRTCPPPPGPAARAAARCRCCRRRRPSGSVRER